MPSLKYSLGTAVFILPLIASCAAVPMAAVGAVSAIDEARRSAYSDISVTPTPGFDLAHIRRVAFVTQQANLMDTTGAGPIFVDHLSSQFLTTGFEIVDSSQFRSGNALAGQVVGANTGPSTEAIASKLDLDAVFSVSAQSSMKASPGLLSSRVSTGITNATLRLNDVETGQTLLVITAAYRDPKEPLFVAEQITGAFREFQNGSVSGTEK